MTLPFPVQLVLYIVAVASLVAGWYAVAIYPFEPWGDRGLEDEVSEEWLARQRAAEEEEHS